MYVERNDLPFVGKKIEVSVFFSKEVSPVWENAAMERFDLEDGCEVGACCSQRV